MYPLVHFTTSLVLTILLYPVFGYNAIWILVGGFLIDTDHYIDYAIRKKDFSLRNAYRYFDNRHKPNTNPEKDLLHIFHTIEFFLLIIILSLFFQFIFITLIGMVFHELLDLVEFTRKKLWDFRAISAIMWMKRHKYF